MRYLLPIILLLPILAAAIPAGAFNSRHVQPTVTAPYPDGLRLGVPSKLRGPSTTTTTATAAEADMTGLENAARMLLAPSLAPPAPQSLQGEATAMTTPGGYGGVRVTLQGETLASQESPRLQAALELVRADAEARAPYLGQWGLADVTRFGADPTGKTDSTKAIQQAVVFARDNQMACYFPSGTYLVSDTIDCIQNLYLRTDQRVGSAYFYPNLLVGQRTPGLPRPKIVLANNAPGFANPGTPKYVVHFWARAYPHGKGSDKPQPNISFNQVLTGIDIDLGQGNAGAVGIHHIGAQGCSVQECAIDATGGLGGMVTGLGAGGSLSNLRITGGEIGLDISRSQSAPTISGITLINQRKAAVVYSGFQALSAVGLNILKEDPRPAIFTGDKPHSAHQGQINLTDSAIEFTGKPGTAVSANDSLYLLNVYVRNAAKVVDSNKAQGLDGRPGKWLHVREFALAVAPRPYKKIQYASVTYVDGRPVIGLAPDLAENQPPPPDLQRRHRWAADLATWQTPGAANVKLLYGAKGDGRTDDTQAIQKAIDENDIVYLPKGYYRISRTLQLRERSRLVGVGRQLSLILATADEGDFSPDSPPAPLVRTAQGTAADNQLSMLCLFVPRERTRAYALDWRCGPNSVFKDVNIQVMPLMGYKGAPRVSRWTNPLVRISGAGRWYGFFHFSAREQGLDYRHVLIDRGNGLRKVRDKAGKEAPKPVLGRLAIYHLNAEHAKSKTNVEIDNSAEVAVYGYKCEGNAAALLLKDSRDVMVLGYGGNASAKERKALFLLENSTDYIFSNLVEFPRIDRGTEKSAFGVGVHPDKWHMLIERPLRGTTIRLPFRDRPVLYRRGKPSALAGN